MVKLSEKNGEHMLIDMIKDREFQEMMSSHLKDTFAYLLERESPFAILCNIEHVTFDPPLPQELQKLLQDLTLFMIAGYTFESFDFDDRFLSFEAGFGPENFGSVVSMPILAVMQVLVEETPILINLANPPADYRSVKEEEGIQSSMETFLSNPENQKFLKKK